MRKLFALSLSASLVCLVACSKHEVKVSMGDLPAPVKATLEKESKGGKVTEIEKESKDGKTVYSADVTTADGKNWDVTVGEDGKLISKKPD
jgi:hypothetical protein